MPSEVESSKEAVRVVITKGFVDLCRLPYYALHTLGLGMLAIGWQLSGVGSSDGVVLKAANSAAKQGPSAVTTLINAATSIAKKTKKNGGAS